jgi:hypothetical protein
MDASEPGRLRRIAFVGGWILALLAGAQPQAGEKIKITDSPDQVQLPKDQQQPNLPPGLFNSKVTGGESSQGPMLPKPGQPVLIRNPKLDELIDRKKNWIFDSPNSVDRARAVEEILGVRRYELDNLEKKPKSQVERYYESRKQSARPNDAKQPQDRRQDGLPSNSHEPDPGLAGETDPPAAESAGIIPELNPAPLFNWDAPPDPFAQLGSVLSRSSILPRGLGEAAFGQPRIEPALPAQPNAAPRENERSWDLRKSALFGGRFGDPIIDQPDATRAIMNPISANKASVPPPESTQKGLAETPSFNRSAPASTRPEFLGPSQSPVMGAPAFKPPTATPISAPVMQPKPVLLEIPRPKF